MSKSLRTLVEMLVGPAVLWLFMEEMMFETSLQSFAKIKSESLFVGGKKPKSCF